MPILNVKVSGEKNAETTAKITELLLDVTTRILKKKRALTAITIQYFDKDSWIIGGELLSKQNKNSIYFDIKITDETNTKEDKKLFYKSV